MTALPVKDRFKLAAALEWKFGPVANCDLDAGTITEWRHPFLPKPPEGELAGIIAEYDATGKTQMAVAAVQARIAGDRLLAAIVKELALARGKTEAQLRASLAAEAAIEG